MQRWLVALALVVAILALATGSVLAAKPEFGQLFYNDQVVRTIVPPAANPKVGRDNFYSVTNGVAGQLDIAAVAPGDVGYHGGHWAVHLVTFSVDPYLLTSEAAVLAAEAAGDVTVVRNPSMDFRCPIQP